MIGAEVIFYFNLILLKMPKTFLLYAVSDEDRKRESRQAGKQLSKQIKIEQEKEQKRVEKAEKGRQEFIKKKRCKPDQAPPLSIFM
jgi:hypothetical protein